jgi:hypothetical protein
VVDIEIVHEKIETPKKAETVYEPTEDEIAQESAFATINYMDACSPEKQAQDFEYNQVI